MGPRIWAPQMQLYRGFRKIISHIFNMLRVIFKACGVSLCSTRYFAQTPIKVVLRWKRTCSAFQNFCPIQNSLRSEEVMSVWKMLAKKNSETFSKSSQKKFEMDFLHRKSLRKSCFFEKLKFSKISIFQRKFHNFQKSCKIEKNWEDFEKVSEIFFR